MSPKSSAVSGRKAKTTRNVSPAAPSKAHFISRVSPGPFSLSGRSHSEQSVGLITNPTNRDELSVMISVVGKKAMNSPTMPGQKSIGAKAASVVAVAAMTGTATSPVASFAASFFS